MTLDQLVQQWRDEADLCEVEGWHAEGDAYRKCAIMLESWLRDPAAQDTRRLDWLESLAGRVWVSPWSEGGWFIEHTGEYGADDVWTGNTLREAIDAALSSQLPAKEEAK